MLMCQFICWHIMLSFPSVLRYTTQVNQPTTMEVNTLNFDYGNAITILGMIGIVSTGVIVISVFRSYFNSPVRK